MTYQYTDGGRVEAGFKSLGDCGIRAVAVACEMSYQDARKLLKEYANKGRQGSRAISHGIYKNDMDAALRSIGWQWNQAPKFKGRKARYSDIPGRAILRMAKHFSVVIDGTLYDSWDSSHKMVYGYWSKRMSRKQPNSTKPKDGLITGETK